MIILFESIQEGFGGCIELEVFGRLVCQDISGRVTIFLVLVYGL